MDGLSADQSAAAAPPGHREGPDGAGDPDQLGDLGRIKQRLALGETVVGHSVSLPSPTVVRSVAVAGSDFVVIDTEHGSLDREAVSNLIMATAGTKCSPLVRIPDTGSAPADMYIRSALDAGAAGICVPHVRDADHARRVIDAAKYPPRGSRAVGAHGALLRWNTPRGPYLEAADQLTLVCLIIESKAAIPHLSTIVESADVDVVWIARSDLAASLGRIGQETHDEVWDATRQIEEIVRPSRAVLGEFARSPSEATRFARSGYQFLCVGADLGLIGAGVQSSLDNARRALAAPDRTQEGLLSQAECGAVDVSIVVTDVDRAMAFYHGILGLQYVERNQLSSGAWLHRLRIGGSEIKLIGPPDAPLPHEPEMFRRCGPSYITFRVTGLEQIAAKVTEAGARVLAPVHEIRPGTAALILEDPDGTHVELKEVRP